MGNSSSTGHENAHVGSSVKSERSSSGPRLPSCNVCMAQKASPEVSLTIPEGMLNLTYGPGNLPGSVSKANLPQRLPRPVAGNGRQQPLSPQMQVPAEKVCSSVYHDSFTRRSNSSRTSSDEEEKSRGRGRTSHRSAAPPPAMPPAFLPQPVSCDDDDEFEPQRSTRFPPLPQAKKTAPAFPHSSSPSLMKNGPSFTVSQCLPKILPCSPAKDSEKQSHQPMGDLDSGSTTAGSSDTDTDTKPVVPKKRTGSLNNNQIQAAPGSSVLRERRMAVAASSAAMRESLEKANAMKPANAFAGNKGGRSLSRTRSIGEISEVSTAASSNSVSSPSLSISPSIYERRYGQGKGLCIETEDLTPRAKTRSSSAAAVKRERSTERTKTAPGKDKANQIREVVATLKAKAKMTDAAAGTLKAKAKMTDAASANSRKIEFLSQRLDTLKSQPKTKKDPDRRGWLSRALGTTSRW